MWSSCGCGVSSSLLEKKHGGVCGGEFASALDSAFRSAYAPKSQVTENKSCGMLGNGDRWVSSCCPAPWSHPEASFILKMLGRGKILEREGAVFNFTPDLCRSCIHPYQHCTLLSRHLCIPLAPFAAKGVVTMCCHASKTCHIDSFLWSFSLSFMFPEYTQTFNNLEL